MINYVATEKDIQATINDFEIFCSYLEEKKPKLTNAREELGKKDCYSVNAMLTKPREMDGPKYLQPSYPTINLFFHIVIEAGLFTIEYCKNDSLYLIPSPKLEKYRSLNPFSRYMFLFKMYWAQLDYDGLMYTKLAFEELSKAEPGVRIFADIEDFDNGYDRTNPIYMLFVGAGLVLHHLRDFGFWEYEEAHFPNFRVSKKDIYIKAVTPTSLGIAMINVCRSRLCEIYNEQWDEGHIEMNWRDEHIGPIIYKLGIKRPLPKTNKEPFEKAFETIFPDNAIDSSIIGVLESEEKNKAAGNTYVFKVSFNRSVWRRIKLSSAHTLQHLHKAIQNAFDFDEDHLYAFFMDGKPWSQNAYWDKLDGQKPSADRAVIGKLGLAKGQRFLYLFDFGDEWRFNVKLEEIQDSKTPPKKATVIEKKGEAPEQYPDWEEDD